MSDKSKKSNQNKRTGKPAVSSSSNEVRQTAAKAAPAASAAASTTSATASSVSQSRSNQSAGAGGGNRDTAASTENKSSGGWLPPVALLFGLLGTVLSAYLWSKLNALNESTTTALTQQQESTKTEVSTVRTELTASLDEKTSALQSKVDQGLATSQTQLADTVAATDAKLEETVTGLQSSMDTMSSEIREESKASNEDIATSTANAMQELTSKSESELNLISTSFNTGIRTLREDMDTRFSDSASQVATLSESLETTHELASRGQRDWILAEVEYLLRTGHHRVKLAGDVKAGILALESANDRLHALGDIDYFPVREQIKQESTELRRLGPPDIEGLIFRLETAGKVADSLPLREKPKAATSEADTTAEESTGSVGSKLGKSFMEKLNFSVAPSDPSATKAKKRNKPTKNQLSASEALNTHLQAARLSALRADAERFQNHMDNAIKYTDEIFDDSVESVKTYRADLEDVRETNIVPNIPILGSALSLFEKIDAKRSKE